MVINFNLEYQEPSMMNNLTDSEKEQAKNFINFLKSQKNKNTRYYSEIGKFKVKIK